MLYDCVVSHGDASLIRQHDRTDKHIMKRNAATAAKEAAVPSMPKQQTVTAMVTDEQMATNAQITLMIGLRSTFVECGIR